jgi:GNAT superfamily N-acetyltransferase
MSEDPRSLTFDGYRPGALAAVIRLHMAYYAREWGFGLPFETKLAEEMGAFLARYDPERDLFLCAYDGAGALVGAVTVDAEAAASEGAHLRWYIVADGARGTGLGRALLERAVSHCIERRYCRLYLTTFAGLDAARHLYESLGFRLIDERDQDQWQGGVREQHFELTWPGDPIAG